MADASIVSEWLRWADEDFAFAEANLREGSTFYSHICFHFQQAAEKYLKALVVAYDLEFEKTHNLTYLLKTASRKEPSLSAISDQCEFLNTAYIDTRYPVHWPTNYTHNKALKSRDAAAAIGRAAKAVLNM